MPLTRERFDPRDAGFRSDTRRTPLNGADAGHELRKRGVPAGFARGHQSAHLKSRIDRLYIRSTTSKFGWLNDAVGIIDRDDGATTHPAGGVIMVVGDVHGDLGWIKPLIERAHQLGVDTLLSVGDWGVDPWPGDPPGTRFVQKTERIAAKNGVRIYVCPGNHENHDSLSELPSRPDGWLELSEHVLVAPRGHRWFWTDVQFGALPGAYSEDHRVRQAGRDWWPEVEEVQPEDVERLGSGDLDILVSHDVPSGVPVGPGALVSTLPSPEADFARAQVSRALLLEAVRRTRPELVLCGHWHQRCSTALGAEVAARDPRPTVGERTLGYVDEARRSRIGVEVLDKEHTQGNWILLDLAELATAEAGAAIARARDRGDR